MKRITKLFTALALALGLTTAASAAEDPAFWYKFDGNYTKSGTSALSFGGENASNFAGALNGQALQIVDGATHPHGSGWNFGSGAWAVTMSAVPVANANNKIVLWTTGTKSGWFGLSTDSTNNKVILGSSSNAEICSVTVPNITDTFHLYTVRCDGNGNYELIVDGDIAGKSSASYTTAIPSGTYQIGAVNQGCPSGYARTTGTLIDDLRIYQRALTDEEVGEIATLMTTPAAEVISVNIGGGRGTGDLAANSDHLVSAYSGLAAAMSKGWNNLAKQWQSGAGTKKFTMAAGTIKATDGVQVIDRNTVSVYVSANNTYDGGKSRYNAFHKGYLDDGTYDGHRAYVKVSDIPYSKYDVIVYTATDNADAKFGAVKINGTAYTWKDSATVAGADAWGDSNVQSTTYGKNALLITDIATPDVEIEGTTTGGRGGIAAVQIVNRGEIIEKHEYTKDMSASCNLSDLFDESELVEGPRTYVTINVTATEPVTLTVDNPNVTLGKIIVNSSVAFTLKSTADLANVALCDFSGVTGKLTLGTGCVKFAPSTMPAAGLRLEGTTAIGEIPYMAAGFKAQLEIACPVTSVGNGGAFVGNKNIVFDEGLALEGDKFSIGNQGNTSQHFEQKGGTITLTNNGDGKGNNGPMLLAHWPGTDRWYKLTGGTLNALNGVIRLGWDGGCALTVGGGEGEAILKTKGIRGGADGRANNGSSLTVGENGTVALGANGIYIGTDNIPMTLAGGKVLSYGYATVTKSTINITAPSTLAAEADKTLTMAANFSGSEMITVGSDTETGKVLFKAGAPENLTVAGGVAVFADRTYVPTEVTGGSVGYYVTVNDLGTFTVPTGLDPANVKLFNEGGEEVTITGIEGQVISFDMSLYGKSCLMEYLYEGNLKSTGSDTGAMQFDGTHCFPGNEYVTNEVGEAVGGIYAASAPWRNVSFPAEVTVVMYGKMMKTDNTCQIGIGSTTGGSQYSLFLASGDVEKEEVVLGYAYQNNAAAAAGVNQHGVLCTMTVPNAQTTEHLYAFTMQKVGNDTVVNIYLDGEVLQPYTFKDQTVTLGSGIQLGSIHGGIGDTQDWPADFGFRRSTAVETDATLEFVRVYNIVLNDTVMREIAEDYPYESPSGSFRRTLTGNAYWTAENSWTKIGEEEPAYAKPDVGSAVTITPPAEDVTLTNNLEATESFEAFTLNVGGKVTIVKEPGLEGKIAIAGRTAINTDATLAYDAIELGGAVTIAPGKTLTFDFSSLDLSKEFESRSIKLTGVATLGEDATVDVTGIMPVAGRTTELVYDDNTMQYSLVITVENHPFVYEDGIWKWDTQEVTAETVSNNTAQAIIVQSDLEWPIDRSDITVETGTLTAKAVAQRAAGVTVKEGAVLDLNGNNAMEMSLTLNGGEVTYGDETTPTESDQIKVLTLTANSEINTPVKGQIYASSYVTATTIALDTYTLTKTGTDILQVVNCDITGTGTIDIQEGEFYGSENTRAATTTFKVAEGATLHNRDGKTMTIAAIEGAGGTLNNEGTMPTFELSGTLTIANAGTFGTITNATGAVVNVGQKHNLTFAGAGTVNAVLTDAQIAAEGPITIFTKTEGATTVGGTVVDKNDNPVPGNWAGGSFQVDHEAKIGDVYYLTLQDALDVGGDVVMLKDVAKEVTIPAGKTVNLDFNGCAITTTSRQAINNYGTLTIANGNITAQESAIVLWGNSTTTISGGAYTANDNAVIMGSGNEGEGDVTLNITGGTFNGNIESAGYIACGIYVPNSGTYTISGGQFNITGGCGICARAGEIKVASEAEFYLGGSTEPGKVGDSARLVPCVAMYTDYEAAYPGHAETDYLKAQDNTLSTYTTQGWFGPDADGYYTLGQISDAEAKIVVDAEFGTTIYYLTFAEALEAATADQTVELLKSITTDKAAAFAIAKNITVDFGTSTITKTVANDWVFDIANGAKVVFKGTTGGITQTASDLNPDSPASMIRNKGILTVEGGVYTSDFCIIKNDEDPGAGELTVTGGTFNMVRTTGGYEGLQMALMNWSTATINGGTWNGTIGTRSCDRNNVSKAGATTIGTLEGSPSYLLYVGYEGDTTWTNMPKIAGVAIADVTLDKNPSVTDELEKVQDGDWVTAQVKSGGTEVVPGEPVHCDTLLEAEKATVALDENQKTLDPEQQTEYANLFTKVIIGSQKTGYTVSFLPTEDTVTSVSNAVVEADKELLSEITPGESVEVSIETKPGLYYSVAVSETLSTKALETGEGDRTMGTGEPLELEVTTPEEATKCFYQIMVNVTDKKVGETK